MQRALGIPGGGGLATAADLALLYQPLINGGKVYGGGQILKAETITNVLAKQQTADKHFTIISHADGAHVDLQAWKAGASWNAECTSCAVA